MELNTEVWGTIANGHNADWGQDTTETGYQLTIGQYYNLYGYLQQNKISYDEPIDNSIAYAGAYQLGMGDIAYIYNARSSGENVLLDNDRMVEFYGEMPFTFGTYSYATRHGDNGTFAQRQNSKSHAFLNFLGDTALAKNNGYYWLNGGDDNNVDNINRLICPFIDFGLRAIFYGIYCYIRDTNGSSSWHWLSELSSYPNYKIERVVMYPYVRHNHGSDWSNYNNAPYEAGSDMLLPIPLKPVKANDTDYMNYYEYLSDEGVITLYGLIGGLWSQGYSDGHFYSQIYIPTELKCNAGMEWNYSYSGGYTFVGWEWCKNHANPTIKVSGSSEDSTGYLRIEDYVLDNTEENREYIRRAAASFGVFFTDGNAFDLLNNNNRWTHNTMCLGLLENGLGKGQYTRGTGNTDNPSWSWTSSHDSGYVPTNPEDDPNTYSNTTLFNPILDLHSMTKRYVLDGAAVDQLGKDLWKISSDLASVDPNDMFKNYEDLLIDNFLTNDPINCIISLDKYPITDIPTGNQKELIRYGKVTGAAQGRPFDKTSYQFTFQSVSIFPRFGQSFLDYEPYTHYELYIPFCGVAQIDPGDIMGKRLSVIEVIDFSTGAVTAYILANELVINSLTGTCNINIPVTGTDGITLNAQINNGILNMKRSQSNAFLGSILSTFSLGGLIKTGYDPAGAANKFMQGQLDVAQSSYELQHTQVPMHTIGAASAVGSWTIELNCRLLIYYPTGEAITDDVPPSLADLSEYGHTTGFACVLQGKVEDFTGLTVGNIVLDGVNATEEEKKMIQALFAQGVYL